MNVVPQYKNHIAGGCHDSGLDGLSQYNITRGITCSGDGSVFGIFTDLEFALGMMDRLFWTSVRGLPGGAGEKTYVHCPTVAMSTG
jgi:hypothetical protein